MSDKARDELQARIAKGLAAALVESPPARARRGDPLDDRYLVVDTSPGCVATWVVTFDREETGRPRWWDSPDTHAFPLPYSNRAIRAEEIEPLAKAIVEVVTQNSGTDAYDEACARVTEMLEPLADYRQLADERSMDAHRNWTITMLQSGMPVRDIIDQLVYEEQVDDDLTIVVTRELAARWLEKVIDDVNNGAQPDLVGEEIDSID